MASVTRLTSVSLQALQPLVELSPDPAVVCDESGSIVAVNEAAGELFGTSLVQLQGASLDLFVPALARTDRSAKFINLVRSGELDADHHITLPDGGGREVWFSTSRLRKAGQERSFVIVTMRDVTERNRMQNMLSELSVRDELTGLHNRRFFSQMAPFEEERARRYNRLLMCAFVDIDNFKAVNDNYGHPFGDQVLVEVAALLRKTVRRLDLLCRFGGDEFAVVSLVTDPQGAEQMFRRLMTGAEKLSFSFRGRPVRVGLTGGGAIGRCRQGLGVTELLERSDQLMLAAKRAGRNRYLLETYE